ncbi:MAG: hypothetical protein JSS82_06415 [Bacteroidetes bacterium]|nr:hypothetical protein [Bacteroidota bacterium]
MRLIIAAIATTIAIASCQKKDNNAATPSDVSITIASPTGATAYHSGDTVFMNADISYATELHGYEVKITDTASGFVVYDDAQHVHDDHFSIRDKWVNTASTALVYKLAIIIAIDHDGKKAEKDIYFQYQP